MAVVKIWKRVTPQWGNDEVPEEDRWSIEVRIRPTLDDFRLMSEAMSSEGVTLIENMYEVIKRLCRNPKCLTVVTDNDQHVAITSSELLAEYCDTDLYNELLLTIVQERVATSGEVLRQLSGGDTTTPPDATAAGAVNEQE